MTRLPDEYEQLAAGLRQAAEREAGRAAEAVPAKRSVWSWASRHTLATVVALACVGGTATAAVLTLRGEPSGGMDGVLKGASSDPRYAIRLTPQPAIGDPGWCTSVSLVGAPGPSTRVGASGCGSAPTTDRLEIVSGFLGGGSSPDASDHRWLMYAIVDGTVAGIRLHGSGRTILSRRDRSIPAGTKLVVAELGRAEYGPPNGQPQVGWDLLDRAGRVLPESRGGDRPDVVARQRWHAVRALLPSGAPCRITFAGSTAELGRVRSTQLNAPPAPTPGLRGRALLGCARTVFLGGAPFSDDLSVTVFLDATTPGAPPMPLPGFRAGPHGTVEAAGTWAPGGGAPRLSAKRMGNAWVVAQGPTQAAQIELLRRVSVDVP